MCGIYGYTASKGEIDRSILAAMGEALRHRGPDDEGHVIQSSGSSSVGLGHQRLSIVDLSADAKQPMANEDGTVWITFNGEIYNFQTLRKELEPAHRFRSKSDTEVILHLYEDMGISCVEKLNGMFAFALWDKSKEALFLARDRIGKKPLHYSLGPRGIVFASEIKGLLKHPGVSKEIDLKALDKYFVYKYIPAPDTIFKSVKKIEPAHYLVYEKGQARLHQYWDIPLEDYPIAYRTEEEYIEELREMLDRAVKSRLVADVPIGLFVSGGVDSGLIAAFAARANQKLECFSIGFDEPSFDERKYAVSVARSLGIKHHVQVFSPQEILATVPLLPDILDEPLADASIFPTYLLSKFASQTVKVVLSGDGGDELFAGYQPYQAHRLITYYDSLPEFLKSALKTIASCLPVTYRYLSPDFRIKQFLRGAGVSSEIRFFLWTGAFTDTEKKALLAPGLQTELKNQNAYEDIFNYVKESGLTKDMERLLYLSMKLYLQDNVLVKVDRASMANSLEVRCPLLDHEFVEFVSHIPMQYKLKGLKTKYLFKKAAGGYLPNDIIHRPKQGFGIPISKWFANELRELVFHYLSEDRIKKQGFFCYPYIRQLVDEHMTKKKDNREGLWTLLVFQIWYERYVGV